MVIDDPKVYPDVYVGFWVKVVPATDWIISGKAALSRVDAGLAPELDTGRIVERHYVEGQHIERYVSESRIRQYAAELRSEAEGCDMAGKSRIYTIANVVESLLEEQ
jgi:hypothetical protein